jgi:hypothetical protein
MDLYKVGGVMKCLVNFATTRFYKSQEKLNLTATKNGVDKVFSFREKDLIGSNFYQANQSILSQRRGAGYWIWKPYFLLKVMSKIKENDIVVYCDSGIEVINPLNPLFKICKQQDGIMLFQTHSQLNKVWTKRDCFVLMNCDDKKYWNAEQVMASFSIFMNNEKNRAFVKEWLLYCCNENIVTDIPNICGLENSPAFRDHRHDQSILSLLAVKHNIEIYRNPSQKGIKYKKFYNNSPYGTILNHHREKDPQR